MQSSPTVTRSNPLKNICQWLLLLALILNSLGSYAQAAMISHEPIKFDQPAGFTLFDRDFYRNQLFLLGESHGVAKPQELDFALFKHLNERAGVRYYVAEVDFVKAQYLNDYLKTGNEATLMAVFKSWVKQQAQWANRDFVRKIQRIRAWNLTLPANRTVQFLGVDAVHDNALTAYLFDGATDGKETIDHRPAPCRLIAVPTVPNRPR